MSSSQRRRLKHENHLALIALAMAGPAVVLAITFIWLSNLSNGTCWILSALILLFLWGGMEALRQRARFPLQTLANLFAAMPEGDYSTRARASSAADALGELA